MTTPTPAELDAVLRDPAQVLMLEWLHRLGLSYYKNGFCINFTADQINAMLPGWNVRGKVHVIIESIPPAEDLREVIITGVDLYR